MTRSLVTMTAAGSAAFLFAGWGPKPLLAPEGQGGTLEAEFKTAIVDIKKATDEVKGFAEKYIGESKSLGKVTEETKQAADKALSELGGVTLRLTEIEQKMVRRGAGEPPVGIKSIGHTFIESEEFKAASALGDRFKGKVNIEVKSITSASVSGTSATTALVPADRQAGIIQLPNRNLVVRDLIAPGRTSSGFIEYVKETLFTNNAGTVAENPSAPKPQSDLAYTLVNAPVRTIAHWFRASKQILSDAPQLQSMIDARLRYGLSYKEDDQLLNGDGTGTNLSGLMTNAASYIAPAGITVQNETPIDRLRLAMLQTTLALFPATGIVLHPTDWAAIELKKDSQNRYLWANPGALLGPTIWGLPVAESLAMAQNNFLVGALKFAAQLFDREDANVLVSTEDQDNFVKNMVTILGEERVALAIYRAAALVKGTFTGTN